jgi:hypothetical protein
MARKQNFNPIRQHSELSAADSAINPLLEASKITTLKVDGKDVPASDAPLADRITALNAVNGTTPGNLDMSELIAANDALSKAKEKADSDLAIANSSVAKLQGDNAKLSTDLATSQASVSTLTASNAELQNRHDAAIRQVGDLTKNSNAINRAVSEMCVSRDVLDLKLSKSATEAEKLVAADAIPVADKLNSLGGAVNAAFNKLGLPIGALPAGNVQGGKSDVKPELKGKARMAAAIKIAGQ